MDPDKFKSIAINIETYKKIEELAAKRFELPISMSKTIEFFIKEAHRDWSKSGNKQSK
jgi:hypothetical protein